MILDLIRWPLSFSMAAAVLKMAAALIATPAMAQSGATTSDLRCTPRALAGGRICVCGGASGSGGGLLLDGEPVQPAEGEPGGTVLLDLPKELAPGSHVLRVAPGGAATGGCEIDVVDIEASLDRERLWRGTGTPMRLVVHGTSEPVKVRIVNETPGIISLEGGDDQWATTSGGELNAVERQVRGIRRGEFGLRWKLPEAPCPCPGDEQEPEPPGDGATGGGSDPSAEDEARAEGSGDGSSGNPWMTGREAREREGLTAWAEEKEGRLAEVRPEAEELSDEIADLEERIAALEAERDRVRAEWATWRERYYEAGDRWEAAADRWAEVWRDDTLSRDEKEAELDRIEAERDHWREEVRRLRAEKEEAGYPERVRELDGRAGQLRRELREARRRHGRLMAEDANLSWNLERLRGLTERLDRRAADRHERLRKERRQRLGAATEEAGALNPAAAAAREAAEELTSEIEGMFDPGFVDAYDRALADYLDFVARYLEDLQVTRAEIPELGGPSAAIADWVDGLIGARDWVEGADVSGGAGTALQALAERLSTALWRSRALGRVAGGVGNPLPVDLVKVPGELYRLLQSLLRTETKEGLRILIEGLGHDLDDVDAWEADVRRIRQAHDRFPRLAERAVALRDALRREVWEALELIALAREQAARLDGVEIPELPEPADLEELEDQIRLLEDFGDRLDGEQVELGWLEPTLAELRATRERMTELRREMERTSRDMAETHQALDRWADAVRDYFAARLNLG